MIKPINVSKKLSDGREVTAKDVVATYDILVDEGHGDPNVYTYWRDKFERPVAESKYIVTVKAKTLNWRNLLYFGNSMSLLPAKYLDELEKPQEIDAPQVSESDDPGDRGGENGAQSNERENLEEKLEDIAELTASGSLDEAQDQLDEMQDISEGVDRDALGEAMGEQETDSQPMAMQQISEMMQEQEALMEDSFEQSLNAAQADQKTPGSGPVNAGEKQESLRQQLEDVDDLINDLFNAFKL